MASNLEAMASSLTQKRWPLTNSEASNLLYSRSNLEAMASILEAMA